MADLLPIANGRSAIVDLAIARSPDRPIADPSPIADRPSADDAIADHRFNRRSPIADRR
jgi:hypothetical protein